MKIMRIVVIGFRLCRPHLLTPWRSPLLRWRLETYGITDASGRLLSADEIDRRAFLHFCTAHRAALWRFLSWADSLGV